MARPINLKCVECSKTAFSPRIPKPDCYSKGACEKKKCYYRNRNKYLETMHKWHWYLRFKDDKCLCCGSINNLESHHVKPQSVGGCHTRENVVTLCANCHKIITSYTQALIARKKKKSTHNP